MKTVFLKRLMLVASLSILPACGGEPIDARGDQGRTAATDSAPASTFQGKFQKSLDAVPGQYIVVLKDSAPATTKIPDVAQALALKHGATVTRTYSHALQGFAMRATDAQARALADRPEVAYVVESSNVYVDGSQSNATWGLDRIDQVNLPLNSTYNYTTAAAGVHVYIIDTGIMTNHPDFGGRATADFSAINDGRGANDCNGHGTHVAGTVGSSTWGVAKAVNLHSVRVFNCNSSATTAEIIAGVDWVTANRLSPAVANMSLSGPPNQALEEAVRRSIASGVVYVVSAGNGAVSLDSCNISPARIPEAITVGATDQTDTRWISSSSSLQSSYGPCLDLFAPGANITSTSITGSFEARSGTSMAAPHVAGVAALYLASNPWASPATVATAVTYNSSTTNQVRNAGAGSPTRLLYSNSPQSCGRLSSGQALAPGQTLWSCAGNARVTHQLDGNVVVHDRLGVLWNTVTPGQTTSTFLMQTDGNLVLYSGAGAPLWHTATDNWNGAYMLMQNDCNLVVYGFTGIPLWNSRTFCR